MNQRGATVADVQRGIETATSATWQAHHHSWRVDGGADFDGDDLTIAVKIEANLIVVTVF